MLEGNVQKQQKIIKKIVNDFTVQSTEIQYFSINTFVTKNTDYNYNYMNTFSCSEQKY